MSRIEFQHRIAAHCETGTVQGMLRHHGLDISEPMVFGIGGGIFFGYFAFRQFAFAKVVFRSRPGTILAKAMKRLGVKGKSRTFRSTARGTSELDRLLDQGVPVSLQVDMFHMEYMPPHMRIHFNAHYINAIGREEDRYHISDAYLPAPTMLTGEALAIGRFVRGDLAPKGFLYHLLHTPKTPPLAQAVRQGIRSACFFMLRIPFGPLGVRGIRTFAETIVKWPAIAEDEDRLAHELLMFPVTAEDMGTGGAGFRFLYASFLQEASELLAVDALSELSTRMRENGDRWRDISLLAAHTGRERNFKPERFVELSKLIAERADVEEAIFRDLAKAV
jgi:hypothetical protein